METFSGRLVCPKAGNLRKSATISMIARPRRKNLFCVDIILIRFEIQDACKLTSNFSGVKQKRFDTALGMRTLDARENLDLSFHVPSRSEISPPGQCYPLTPAWTSSERLNT